MPLYYVTCNGSLILKSGPVARGGEVEMSEAEALTLPLGTVTRVQRAAAIVEPIETPSESLSAEPAAPIALPTPPVVKAPRSRKGHQS